MNTIGVAMLHVTRTAGVDPQPANQHRAGLGIALAAWLARTIAHLGRIGRARG